MIKAGYDKKFASGVICSGGCLGILIPPSIMLIVYSVIAQLSPTRLFAAAIFPGIMLAGLYIIYAVTRAYFKTIELLQNQRRRYSSSFCYYKRSFGFISALIFTNYFSPRNDS